MYSIITLLKHWARNAYFEVDTNVLAQMQEFALSIGSSETMRRLGIELHSVATERAAFQGHYQPISPPLSHVTISQGIVRPTEARDLAIAFLIVERDRYTHIRPADWISYFENQPGQNKVKAACETNDIIVNWVKMSVLTTRDLDARSDVLKFLVYTAEVTGHLVAVLIVRTDCCICRNLVNCVISRPCQQLSLLYGHPPSPV